MPAAIPFDVPYGPPIVLDRAQEALAAAAVEAGRRGWKMNIADLDSGGQLAALVRMDGTQLGSIAAAQHKARVAALFSRETRFFESAVQVGFTAVLPMDDIIGSRRGIPLTETGRAVAAVGCSGGTGAPDELVCKIGAGATR